MIKLALAAYMLAATMFFAACAFCLCACAPGYIWRSNEGNWYLIVPGMTADGDPNQVQLNPHTHY